MLQLQGISPRELPPTYVHNFEDISDLQLPNYNITFTETLKDKVRNESRLKWNERPGTHIELSGKILGFTVPAASL